uniref:Reverse transcriptase N-terminal domain-containing protein n=1 Tax=Liagora harveyana TaxID=406718 RepID=A0A1G4NVC0_9FLOR|nr:Hypothetical protein ORF_3 [Liagora harveyana]SCW22554.1 Hypothetical protein ORF_3 [Liagora harveyana]
MQVIIQDVVKKNLILTQALRYEREQSLFRIQKKIYQASQECDNLMVHSLQKLLISLKSIRELAIETAKLYNHYYINKCDNYEVDEIIMLWCLEAEWQPKIKENNQYRKRYFHLNKWSFHYGLNTIELRNVDYQYLVAKIQPISFIENTLSKCLKLQYIVQERIYTPSVFKNAVSFKIVGLLKTILQLGIDWNYYRQELRNFIDDKIMYDFIINEIYLFDNKNKRDLANRNIAKQFFYNSSILNQQFFESNFKKQNYLKQFVEDTTNQYLGSFMNEIMMSTKTLTYRKNSSGRYRLNSPRHPKAIERSIIRTLDIIFIYYRILKKSICMTVISENISKRLDVWTKKQINISSKHVRSQLYSY